MAPRKVYAAAAFIALNGLASAALAQAAGAGADFNKADRKATAKETAKQVEIERLKKVDPPIKPDPLGNALVGGALTGAITGSAAAAGATVVGRTAVQAGANKIKDEKTK